MLKDSEIYECEHENKILRKINSDYIINVCDNCFNEFNDDKTRPLFLAKQILTLSNNMIWFLYEHNVIFHSGYMQY